MRLSECQRRLFDRAQAWPGIKRFKRHEDGATAVEFGLIALPFCLLVVALMGFAMFFFVSNSLDKGIDQSSRAIRTGQAQKQVNANPASPGMTVQEFKQSICTLAGGWIDCNKMQVFVQKFPDWASVAPNACLNSSGSVNTSTASGSDKIAQYAGTASQIVIVTTCYKWEFTQKLPSIIHLGNMSDGSLMMQSTISFRTEPYS